MIHLVLHGILYLWLGLLAIWLLAAIGNKRTVTRQTSSSRLTQIAIEVAGFVLLFYRGFDSIDGSRGWLAFRVLPQTETVVFAGLGITLLGMVFCFWARITLGRNWSGVVTIKRDHQLIRRGPYRIVRHPIYTGLILAAFGTAIAGGRLRHFLGVLLIAFGWWLKLRIEEQFMLQQFGEEYARYRHEVRGLIPFIL
jgi:protein-S-isoprenylcysteine O-methyltransferase Ste14